MRNSFIKVVVLICGFSVLFGTTAWATENNRMARKVNESEILTDVLAESSGGDRYEPNDLVDQSFDWGTIIGTKTYTGTIHNLQDVDYYRIQVADQHLLFQLESPSGKNYRLSVFDATDEAKIPEHSFTETEANLRRDHSYIVKVDGNGNYDSANSYQVKITILSDTNIRFKLNRGTKHTLTWPLYNVASYELMVNNKLIETTSNTYTFYDNGALFPRKYNVQVRGKYSNGSYDSWKTAYIKVQQYGDVDEDGEVAGGDVTKLDQYLSGRETILEEQKILADLDENGEVTQEDVDLLQKYLLWVPEDQLSGTFASFYYLERWQNPTSVESYQLGDVDLDGKITTDDATMITDFVFGRVNLDVIQETLADIDGDGKITTDDSVEVIDYLQGHGTSSIGQERVFL